jgi:hypothetical protein
MAEYLLQGDHIRVDLAQYTYYPGRADTPVQPATPVHVVGGDSNRGAWFFHCCRPRIHPSHS